jgi:NhaP-type Na+/H+ or K+/H+ antiporter
VSKLDRYDPKKSHLRPHEWFMLYPRTAGSVPLLMGLTALGFLVGDTGWIILVMVAVAMALFAPGWFEPFLADREDKREHTRKRESIITERATRRKPFLVIAEPEGEYVNVHVYRRTEWGDQCHDQRQFHAENDAEAAHEYIESLRAAHEPAKPSPDAQALANVLNKAA